jgi:glycosyltransferase involved in cell wall biosynthesis
MALAMPLRRYGVVIQLHARFLDCGYSLARKLGVPFVLRVEALETREEASWGVHRPIWRPLVETWGEKRIFANADLLLPISSAVDGQLASLGIPKDKRQVVPNGVDLELFHPGPPDDELFTAYQMDGQLRVGWVGGFRPFHGLELLPAFADKLHEALPDAVLYLVGTGPLRRQVEAQMADRAWVRLVGAVPHQDVPRWIRCFDVAILAAGSEQFHYSPLKLYEYLACGAPVVAPDVGDIGREVPGATPWVPALRSRQGPPGGPTPPAPRPGRASLGRRGLPASFKPFIGGSSWQRRPWRRPPPALKAFLVDGNARCASYS